MSLQVSFQGALFSPFKVSIAFRRACKRSGIDNLRFHDLRHDFASNLVQAGIDIYTVKELLGHKDLKMTVRYCHLAPENLRDAVKVLDKKGNGYTLVTVGKNEVGLQLHPLDLIGVPNGIRTHVTALKVSNQEIL